MFLDKPLKKTLSLLLITAAVMMTALRGPARAQEAAPTPPVNLSRSGAASQPRLLVASDGRMQVFWWDQFDGLMTAWLEESESGTAWSAPVAAPAPSFYRGAVQTFEQMPDLVADKNGYAHVFWLGKPISTSTQSGSRLSTPLLHASMPLGTAQWSAVETVAESAAAWALSPAADGGLSLAYFRTLNSELAPAGVYFKRLKSAQPAGRNQPVFGAPAAIDTSIYYRLVTPERAWISLADGGDGRVFVAWEDARRKRVLFAESINYGASWSAPEELGAEGQSALRPRVAVLADGSALRIWQDAAQGGCALYQQVGLSPLISPESGSTSSPASGSEFLPAAWGEAQRILEELNTCPGAEGGSGGEAFAAAAGASEAEERLVWMWGMGTPAISLASWEAGGAAWSKAGSLSASFADAETGAAITLNDLRAQLAGEGVAVVGSDGLLGEVWALQGLSEPIEQAAEGAASPWSGVQRLAAGAQVFAPPAMANGEGLAHLAWVQSAANGGRVLVYARWGGEAAAGSLSREVEVARANKGELLRQPSILFSDGANPRLHLVWSGGPAGSIYYSRANIDEALASGGWSPAQVITATGGLRPGAWPQIGQDGAGRMLISFLTPVNEGRGVTVKRSTDGGLTWAEGGLAFDAAAAGWNALDQLSMLVTPTGRVYLAFVQGGLDGSPAGIFSMASDDGGLNWSGPVRAAEAGFDWPHLGLAAGQVHLVYAAVDGSGLWGRRLGLDEAATGTPPAWGPAARLPAWAASAPGAATTQNSASFSSEFSPFGLAADGDGLTNGSLHLIAAEPGSADLIYLSWAGSWSSAQRFAPQGAYGQAAGAAVSAPLTGGRLAVSWLADPAVVAQNAADNAGASSLAGLFLTGRGVAQVQAERYVAEATATPEGAAPTATVEPGPPPTATPELNVAPLPQGEPVSPLILGGGLAALIIVAGAVLSRMFWKNRG